MKAARLRAIAGVLVVCGCRIGRPVPGLPVVDTSRFQKNVAAAIEQALTEAKTHSNDSDSTLRLCMLLHAYEQYQAAGQCYARANAIAPGHFDTLYCWGHALAAEGAYSAAAER